MSKTASITVLQWAVAAVSLISAARLLFMLGHHGILNIPTNVLRTISLAEIVAAVLFVIPRSLKIGGVCLLIVYCVAAAVHVLHGQYDVLSLVVLAAAVWAVLESK